MLPKIIEAGQSISQHVCKTFFIETLAITARFVSTAHHKQSHIGMCEHDKRGHHNNRPNKTSGEKINLVKFNLLTAITVEKTLPNSICHLI